MVLESYFIEIFLMVVLVKCFILYNTNEFILSSYFIDPWWVINFPFNELLIHGNWNLIYADEQREYHIASLLALCCVFKLCINFFASLKLLQFLFTINKERFCSIKRGWFKAKNVMIHTKDIFCEVPFVRYFNYKHKLWEFAIFMLLFVINFFYLKFREIFYLFALL